MDKLLNLAVAMRARDDIGFFFIGRGSEVRRLSQIAGECGLDNVLFEDEISPEDIPGLYRQCHIGMICLDSRHKTHNIPGKFLTYMQAGLPVLASINDGNDLQRLVETRRVGCVSVEPEGRDLPALADRLIRDQLADPGIVARCRALSDELFSNRAAVEQIVMAVTIPTSGPL
jgi:glycosyltransferase involved in cell wall biosynthesis